jgi:hypothetical protein
MLVAADCPLLDVTAIDETDLAQIEWKSHAERRRRKRC